MATTFTPTGDGYTWADAAWAWTDTRAGKTWEQQAPGDWLRTDDEAPAFSVVTAQARGLANNVSDAFAAGDAAARSIVNVEAEDFGMSAGYVDIFGSIVNAVVALFVEDEVRHTFGQHDFRETLRFRDTLDARLSTCTGHYVWATSIFTWASPEGHRTWADPCIITWGSQAEDSIRAYDALKNSLVHDSAEEIPFLDGNYINNFLEDSFTITDSTASGGLFNGVEDEFSLSEVHNGEFVRVAPVALVVDVAADAMVDFERNFAEAILLSDILSHNMTNGISVPLSMSSAPSREAIYERGYSETFGVFDTYSDLINFISTALESIYIEDAERKVLNFSVPDAVTMTDAVRFVGNFNVNDTFDVASSYQDLGYFIIDAFEYPSFTDRVEALKINTSLETLHVSDRLWRAANAVIGDLEFYDEPMNASEFGALFEARHPLGFTDWQTFLAGDYEFQKAFLRVSLASPPGTVTDVSITRAILNVDVPDISNSGRVAIPAAWTEIDFETPFTAEPELGCVQYVELGDVVGLAVSIRNVTVNGFEVRLTNPSTGLAHAGSVSFTAHGR